jgi:DNA-directed RNA polymerase subunit RPC12/RpoP
MSPMTNNPAQQALRANLDTKATRPEQNPEGNLGLACRHCGGKHFRVVYTRPSWGGRIMRRRACRNCGKRMTTWERSIVG